MLQKTYSKDFLSKKRLKNEGEVPQYFIEHSHPAIIDPKEFDLVQEMRKNRGLNCNNTFASKLICGDCGDVYGAKVWHSNDKYRKVVYRCNGKYNKENQCQTPALGEIEIKAHFVDAVNQILRNRSEVIAGCKLALDVMGTDELFNEKLQTLWKQMDSLALEMRELIDKNASNAMPQDEFTSQFEKKTAAYDALCEQSNMLETQKKSRSLRLKRMEIFLKQLASCGDLLTEFDDDLWALLLERAVVFERKLVFEFVNGEIVECRA